MCVLAVQAKEFVVESPGLKELKQKVIYRFFRWKYTVEIIFLKKLVFRATLKSPPLEYVGDIKLG